MSDRVTSDSVKSIPLTVVDASVTAPIVDAAEEPVDLDAHAAAARVKRLEQARAAFDGGTWTGSELFTTDRLGFGTYQWQVDSPIDTIDKNVVVGLFPYGPQAGIDAGLIRRARPIAFAPLAERAGRAQGGS